MRGHAYSITVRASAKKEKPRRKGGAKFVVKGRRHSREGAIGNGAPWLAGCSAGRRGSVTTIEISERSPITHAASHHSAP
jgi:hypothetical protein